MDTLTMNIKREFFERIVAKTKRIEYRERSASGGGGSNRSRPRSSCGS
jgi:hypothetical protein